MKFGPNTKIHLECEVCESKETILLKDLPHTPGGKFIFPPVGQCADCLSVITGVVRPEDVERIQ